MIKKLVLGAVLGGLTAFLWGFVSHVALQFHESSIQGIPNEGAVIDSMQANIKTPGFYFFPYEGHDGDEAEMTAWTAKYKAGPTGVLIYNPTGSDPMSPKQLGVQFTFEVLCAFLASLLLCLAGGPKSFSMRIVFVGLLGVFGSVLVDFPYWNWYGFPLGYTMAQLFGHAIGWTLVGCVLAWVFKPVKK